MHLIKNLCQALFQPRKPRFRRWPRLKVEMAVILLVLLPLIGWAQTTQDSRAINPLLEPATVIGLDGNPYEPMTDQQIQEYLKKITPAQLFADIRKLDIIEHARPVFSLPDLVIATTTKNTIVLGWVGDGKLDLNVAGYLDYKLQLKPQEIKGMIPADSPWAPILGIGLGVITTAGLEYALSTTNMNPFLGMGISVGTGALVGSLMYGLMK